MSLADSLFVSNEVFTREVELPNGEKHPLYFKQIPAAEFRRFQLAEQSENEDTRAGSIAKLICASLCEADGKPAITYTQALKLTAGAANAILTAVLDVNGFGGKNA